MIDSIPLIGLSAPTLLGVAIALLLTGKIVPRATLMDRQKEMERWREAYEREREARAVLERQTEELTELAKTTHAIIVAMFQSVGPIKPKERDSHEI